MTGNTRQGNGIGIGTFLLITVIWMLFWCELQGGFKELAKRILGRK
jgi:hypothetical protein